MRLFDVPDCAVPAASEPSFPLGGIGGGHFVWDDAAKFRGWRLQTGVREADEYVAQDQFHVWWSVGGKASSVPLVDSAVLETRRLFPITWRRYILSAPEAIPTKPILESASFSPLLPTDGYERSLPIHIVAFRAHNPSVVDMDVALLLTWACAWPDLVADSRYDMQHDNLCITGSLGSPESPNRQGIAVPDLHYVGIYQQGVEPWVVPAEEEDVVEDFVDDGELDSRVVRSTPHGAAAWLKFSLEPGETKEAPFVLTWHFPNYEFGPDAGRPRYYTQFLGRRRPDNAIVWLAEQAFQHFGAETANYRYWYQAIRDWQDASGKRASLNGLAELLRADLTWTEESPPDLTSLPEEDRARLVHAGLPDIWPDLLLGR